MHVWVRSGKAQHPAFVIERGEKESLIEWGGGTKARERVTNERIELMFPQGGDATIASSRATRLSARDRKRKDKFQTTGEKSVASDRKRPKTCPSEPHEQDGIQKSRLASDNLSGGPAPVSLQKKNSGECGIETKIETQQHVNDNALLAKAARTIQSNWRERSARLDLSTQIPQTKTESAYTSENCGSDDVTENVNRQSSQFQALLLEEEIAILETSLGLLRRNRAETITDLERWNSVQRESVTKLQRLQEDRVVLRKRRTRQTKLVKSIRASLAQTRARLQRLPSCVTIEEMEELGKAESEQAKEQENEFMTADEPNDPNFSFTQAHSVEIGWPSMKPLLHTNGFYLLPALTCKEHIERAMTVISNQVEDHTRRDYFRGTCLDIGLISSEVMAEPSSANANNTSCPIEPRVPLCPFELVGTCADPECSYQHLEERPFGRVIPRELIALPDLDFGSKQSSSRTSLQYRSTGSNATRGMEGTNSFVPLPKTQAIEAEPTRDDTEDDGHMQARPNRAETLSGDHDSLSKYFTELGVDFSKRVGSRLTINNHENHVSRQLSIIDCAAFCLHSGRLDVFDAIRLSITGCLRLGLDCVYDVVVDLNSTRSIFQRSLIAQYALAAIRLIVDFASETQEPLGPEHISQSFLGELVSIKSIENTTTKSWTLKSLTSSDNLPKIATIDDLKMEILNIRADFATMATSEADEDNHLKEQLLQENVSLGCFADVLDRLAGPSYCLVSLRILMVISRMILTLIRIEANKKSIDSSFHNNGETGSLCGFVDNIIRNARSLVSFLPCGDVLLAPLVAASVALKASYRLYGEAHKRLNLLLNESKPSEMPYSEILWSQLIQLRATLPNRDVDPVRRSQATTEKTRSKNLEWSRHLAGQTLKRNVFPRHVHLRHDEKLDRSISGSADFVGAVFDTAVRMRPLQKPSIDVSFRGSNFEAQMGNTSSTAIPHSLFWLAPCVIRLDISEANIRALPQRFGEYFAQLRYLDISHNKISVLPTSINLLQQLEELRFSVNRLDHLPDKFSLPSLKVLIGRDNGILHLPQSIKDCASLEVLDLENNSLNKMFWQLASQLPKLRVLRPRQQQGSN